VLRSLVQAEGVGPALENGVILDGRVGFSPTPPSWPKEKDLLTGRRLQQLVRRYPRPSRLSGHTPTQDAVDSPKMVQVVCRFQAGQGMGSAWCRRFIFKRHVLQNSENCAVECDAQKNRQLQAGPSSDCDGATSAALT
jgi:hypothetical protein